jgi:hypothetical protein
MGVAVVHHQDLVVVTEDLVQDLLDVFTFVEYGDRDEQSHVSDSFR